MGDMAWTTELGLAGLAISGLLSLVWYVIHSFSKRDDSRTRLFTGTVKELDDKHRTERAEWRADSAMRESRANQLMEQLHQTIKEIAKGGP